jgi:hypothetical protein
MSEREPLKEVMPIGPERFSGAVAVPGAASGDTTRILSVDQAVQEIVNYVFDRCVISKAAIREIVERVAAPADTPLDVPPLTPRGEELMAESKL